MNYPTQTNNSLLEIVQAHLDEIMVYKWLESEKAGYDIGWDTANQEWTTKHFPAWKRGQWNESVQSTLHTV